MQNLSSGIDPNNLSAAVKHTEIDIMGILQPAAYSFYFLNDCAVVRRMDTPEDFFEFDYLTVRAADFKILADISENLYFSVLNIKQK